MLLSEVFLVNESCFAVCIYGVLRWRSSKYPTVQPKVIWSKLHSVHDAQRKQDEMRWEPWRCEGLVGAVPAEPRRTLGSSTKQSKLVSFNYDLVLSLTVCCTHMNPRSSIRAQEDSGLLDKEALYPFGRTHEAAAFCFPSAQLLKQTSTQRQNKSLDPINYRIYQILCSSAHFVVMLNYTLLALAALI